MDSRALLYHMVRYLEHVGLPVDVLVRSIEERQMLPLEDKTPFLTIDDKEPEGQMDMEGETESGTQTSCKYAREKMRMMAFPSSLLEKALPAIEAFVRDQRMIHRNRTPCSQKKAFFANFSRLREVGNRLPARGVLQSIWHHRRGKVLSGQKYVDMSGKQSLFQANEFEGHKNAIRSAEFACGNSEFVMTNDGGVLKMWNLSKGLLRRVYYVPNADIVTSFAFSLLNNILVGGGPQILCFWRVSNGVRIMCKPVGVVGVNIVTSRLPGSDEDIERCIIIFEDGRIQEFQLGGEDIDFDDERSLERKLTEPAKITLGHVVDAFVSPTTLSVVCKIDGMSSTSLHSFILGKSIISKEDKAGELFRVKPREVAMTRDGQHIFSIERGTNSLVFFVPDPSVEFSENDLAVKRKIQCMRVSCDDTWLILSMTGTLAVYAVKNLEMLMKTDVSTLSDTARSATSLDVHPEFPTIFVVGCTSGDIIVYDFDESHEGILFKHKATSSITSVKFSESGDTLIWTCGQIIGAVNVGSTIMNAPSEQFFLSESESRFDPQDRWLLCDGGGQVYDPQPYSVTSVFDPSLRRSRHDSSSAHPDGFSGLVDDDGGDDSDGDGSDVDDDDGGGGSDSDPSYEGEEEGEEEEEEEEELPAEGPEMDDAWSNASGEEGSLAPGSSRRRSRRHVGGKRRRYIEHGSDDSDMDNGIEEDDEDFVHQMHRMESQRKRGKKTRDEEIDLTFSLSEWLRQSSMSAIYIPQIGDHVVYVKKGHQAYASRIMQTSPQDLPWNIYPDLPEILSMEVVRLRYVCPDLSLFEFSCEADLKGGEYEFTVRFRHERETPDFVMLISVFEASITKLPRIGHKVGTLVESDGKLKLCPCVIKGRKFFRSNWTANDDCWENVQILWMGDGGTSWINAWEVWDVISKADRFIIPEEDQGKINEFIERAFTSLPQGWRFSHLKDLCAPDDFNRIMSLIPLDLKLLRARLSSNYYRNAAMFIFDVEHFLQVIQCSSIEVVQESLKWIESCLNDLKRSIENPTASVRVSYTVVPMDGLEYVEEEKPDPGPVTRMKKMRKGHHESGKMGRKQKKNMKKKGKRKRKMGKRGHQRRDGIDIAGEVDEKHSSPARYNLRLTHGKKPESVKERQERKSQSTHETRTEDDSLAWMQPWGEWKTIATDRLSGGVPISWRPTFFDTGRILHLLVGSDAFFSFSRIFGTLIRKDPSFTGLRVEVEKEFLALYTHVTHEPVFLKDILSNARRRYYVVTGEIFHNFVKMYCDARDFNEEGTEIVETYTRLIKLVDEVVRVAQVAASVLFIIEMRGLLGANTTFTCSALRMEIVGGMFETEEDFWVKLLTQPNAQDLDREALRAEASAMTAEDLLSPSPSPSPSPPTTTFDHMDQSPSEVKSLLSSEDTTRRGSKRRIRVRMTTQGRAQEKEEMEEKEGTESFPPLFDSDNDDDDDDDDFKKEVESEDEYHATTDDGSGNAHSDEEYEEPQRRRSTRLRGRRRQTHRY